MKKEILIATLCAGLMLVTPLTSIAQENKITTNIVEEPDIGELVIQIRTLINDILVKYGHIPMVRSLCNVILNSLGLIGKIIFCILLVIITIPVLLLFLFFLNTFGEIPPTLGGLLLLLAMILDDECPQPSTPYRLFSPIQTFDGCPCLQE